MVSNQSLSSVKNLSQTGRCRICGGSSRPILDLGKTPPANWLMRNRDDEMPEYPLVLESCACGNFQLRDCLDSEILYRHYEYATPQTKSLSSHYDRLLRFLLEDGLLDETSRVVEIGSNNGSFLQRIAPHAGSAVGVDPAKNVAARANANGIHTIPEFFDAAFAQAYKSSAGEADLIVARHCMAHNSDPYAILDGVLTLLSPGGAFVMENAYAIDTFENNEFDQIYHEHMFYYTLLAIDQMFSRRGLVLCNVLYSNVHGGSISCVARRADCRPGINKEIPEALEREKGALNNGLAERFANASIKIRLDLHALIQGLISDGKSVFAYGATAKGATLLNVSGLTYREIPYCADSTPTKQGRFVPKCGVEIVSETWAFQNPPDAFLLTAWNYQEELMHKVAEAGLTPQFILPGPSVTVVRA